MTGFAATPEFRGLTKRFGDKTAVDRLSFTVEPGQVTGFPDPNGAGKSTMMRLSLGLDRPPEGTATIGGRAYHEPVRPLGVVGAMPEARAVHPGRSAYRHLPWPAQSQGLPRRRVVEAMETVGIGMVGERRAGAFSLGMAQRLGIAAALPGDPAVLALDEPVNGLDPAGVQWIRGLMKRLTAEGRTVLVPSHLMNEMAVTADHLVIIAKGRPVADCPTAEFAWSPQALRLIELPARQGVAIRPINVDTFEAAGREPMASTAQIAIRVLGVMSIGSEHTTGLIQAGALAVPRRVGLIASRTLIFGGLILLFAELVAVPVPLIGRMILSPHVTIDLRDGTVIRVTLGFGVYLAEVGLFAMAIGTMIRNLTGAITPVLGIILVRSNAATLVPGDLGDRIEAYLPGGEKAQAIMSSAADPSAILTPLLGLTVMTAWALVLLRAATVLLRVRDIPEVRAAV